MAKRVPGPDKSKKSKKVSLEESQGRTPDEFPKEAEKPFDFSGLPVRDLKKNLGCG